MPRPVNAYDTKGIDQLIIGGTQLSTNLREQLTQASVSLSTDEVSEITLGFIDPGYKILRSGLFVPDIRVDLDDLAMSIATISTAENQQFNVKARPLGVRALKELKGAYVLSDLTPSDYVRREVINAAKTYPMDVLIQPSSDVRQQIARDLATDEKDTNDRSAWSTLKRLADEVGYIMFEYANVLHFAKPTWLVANNGWQTVVNFDTGDVASRCLNTPSATKSKDAKETTISFELPMSRSQDVRPGAAVVFSGIPLFNGTYIVNSVDFDLLDQGGTVSVTASTPVDPEPHPPATTTSDSTSLTGYSSTTVTGGGANKGTKRAADMVYWAQKQIGDRYVFGASPSGDDPGAFDCCLTGDTMIQTIEGPKLITEVQPLDGVYTYQDGERVVNSVIAVARQPVQTVYKMWVRGKTIKASGNHPFLTVVGHGYDWVRLDQLRVGDLVVQSVSDGPWHRFMHFLVEKIICVGELPTYDLEIDGAHNYIANDFVVHNSALVQWACKQVGVSFPRTSEPQMQYCRDKGTTISVAEASRLRGAFLWHHGHAAISLGDGSTVEAANSRVGVIHGKIGSRFTGAARIPGLIYN